MTDYHKDIRDAVAAALKGSGFGLPVVTCDNPEDALRVASVPAVLVACVGPEQDRPGMGTNASDGLGLGVAVLLLAAGVSSGAAAPDAGDLTRFRRKVRELFHHKRLAGVTEVGWCEVDGGSRVVSERADGFQKLSTELVVVAVGRFPRTT